MSITFPAKPLTNVTPFTYRDGYTYLQVLEDLRAYFNGTVVGEVNSVIAELVENYTTALADFIAEHDTALTDLDAARQQAVTDLQAAFDSFAINLSDTEVRNIISKPLSGLSYHETNTLLGSISNAINAASGDAAILSGGRDLMENVIGGFEGNVNDFDNSNLPADKPGAYDYSVIIGGYDNVLNALASFVAGQHCLISEDAGAGGGDGGAGHHAILGGSIHKILSGGYHTIVGGTQHTIDATGNGGIAAGGEGNTVSGAWAGTFGGRQNVASGDYSNVSGGTNNEATGPSSTVVGGNTNVSSGMGTTVGGRQNTADEDNSTAFGMGGQPSQEGGLSVANGMFSERGDAQAETFVMRKLTTTADPVNLGLAGTATPATIDPNTTWAFTGMVVAQNIAPDVEHNRAWKIEGAIRRPLVGTAQMLGTPTITDLGNNLGADTWDIDIALGTGAFNIMVTGAAATSIRWVARVDVVQVQG